MQIKEVTNYLATIIPTGFQESYDNAGLQVGNPNDEVRGVLISLDLTEAVADEAIDTGCNLIVTHHPFIFGGLKKIDASTASGRLVYKLISHGISVFSAHTNLDKLNNGVSALLAKHLGLTGLHVLAPEPDSLKQLVVYCPAPQSQALKNALYNAGAGNIGNYRHCSYSVDGAGTFEPLPGADPFLGTVGKPEKTAEERIEVIYPKALENNVLSAMRTAHPYEEPAFAILPLDNPNNDLGLGTIGRLPQPTDVRSFLSEVKQILHLPVIRHSALCRDTVEKVAVCGGSGAEFIGTAMAQGADIYLTADLKYHDFQKAAGQIVLGDIGHYESEQFAREFFYNKISEKFRIFAVRLATAESNFVGYM